MSENDIIFRRRITADKNGYYRLNLPKCIGDALKLKKGDDIGLIWREGYVILAPWPEEA